MRPTTRFRATRVEKAEPARVDLGREKAEVVKALMLGVDEARSTPAGEFKALQVLSNAGGLMPPYDPEILIKWYELSAGLRPNIDAYAASIDSYGHRFVAAVDLDAEDVDTQIADILYARKMAESGGVEFGPDDFDPKPEEIAAEKARLRVLARREHNRLQSFFHGCGGTKSFIRLRRLTRTDLEVTGNAYWEVLRNRAGAIARFEHIPSYLARILPLAEDAVDVPEFERVTPVDYEEVTVRRKVRRFVQLEEATQVATFFKEFGDTRVMSSRSGTFFKTAADLAAAEGADAKAATEVIHFKIDWPSSPYGVPRWVGAYPEVGGSRAASEVNYLYFDNKSVPPLAMLVSGGRLKAGVADRIQNYIEEKLHGRANFNKIMLVEAESDGKSGAQARIELKSLNDVNQKDGLFQNYDERNLDKIGAQFRVPRLLRGDTRDFNRACYSADTETLTESGWKRYGEIGRDEKIAAYNPDTGEVAFVVPEKLLVYSVVNETMVRVKNAHSDCLVTEDHRMLVRSAQTRAESPPWEVFPAGSIPYDRFEVVQAAEVWRGSEMVDFALPKSDKCQIERGHTHGPRIAADDWLEFLGYWISEGGVLGTVHPAAPYLVYLDQKKPVIVAKIRDCLDRIGWSYSEQLKPCGTTHFLFSNRCLREWLVANCGTHAQDKRIPDVYLGLCSRQLRVLFDAMVDGDGSRDPRANRTCGAYYTSSSVLAGQVQRLLVQLGLRNSLKPATRCLRVSFSESKTSRMVADGGCRTPASVTRQKYTGEVYCFSVPGFGFFVTRRNGKIAIQGNTAEAAMRLTEEQVFGPEREEFDWLINVRLFPAMGIRFWRFQSRTPVTKDPERLGKLIALLAGAGIILPKEARRLASDVFNVEMPDIKEPWAARPIAFTLAGIQTGGSADGTPTAKAGGDAQLLEEARGLLALSERLRGEQEALQERRMKMAREMAGVGEPDLTLSIPKSEWDEWILPTRDVA